MFNQRLLLLRGKRGRTKGTMIAKPLNCAVFIIETKVRKQNISTKPAAERVLGNTYVDKLFFEDMKILAAAGTATGTPTFEIDSVTAAEQLKYRANVFGQMMIGFFYRTVQYITVGIQFPGEMKRPYLDSKNCRICLITDNDGRYSAEEIFPGSGGRSWFPRQTEGKIKLRYRYFNKPHERYGDLNVRDILSNEPLPSELGQAIDHAIEHQTSIIIGLVLPLTPSQLNNWGGTYPEIDSQYSDIIDKITEGYNPDGLIVLDGYLPD